MLSSMPKPHKKTIIDGNNTRDINKSSWKVVVQWWANKANINSASGKVEVEGDNYGLINTSSGAIKVNHNKGSINAQSWSVKVGESNDGNIMTQSWNIKIRATNKWTLIAQSGSISMIMNEWDITTQSWHVSLETTNWTITTQSGNIKAESSGAKIITNSGSVKMGLNIGDITTSSGSINISDYNRGSITTSSWNIIIKDMEIRIEKINSSTVTINTSRSVGGVLGWIKFGWGSIVSGNIISGSNQSISIINGVEQGSEWGSDKYLVHIDDITVDFEEKIVKKSGKDIDLFMKKEISLKVEEDSVSLVFKWQKITILSDNVIVESISNREQDSDSEEEDGIDLDDLRKYIK